jgi:hypothetical protein
LRPWTTSRIWLVERHDVARARESSLGRREAPVGDYDCAVVWRPMSEPTTDDIDALVGPATPHFAFQIRARVREAIESLPGDHPVRVYGEQQIELLERLGYASTKAENSESESRERIGWETIPSSAPASDPLPRNAA